MKTKISFVRPGTDTPVYVVCDRCGAQVLISIGEVDARGSNCQHWVRR